MLQGCVLGFTTHFPSKPGKGPPSLFTTPHRHWGKLSLQLPLAGQSRREGWSLRPAQLQQKVMQHVGWCVPVPQACREQGCFLSPAMWPGQPGLTPVQGACLCTERPPSWLGTAQTRVPSEPLPSGAGAGSAPSPAALPPSPAAQTPARWPATPSAVAAVHRAWLDEYLNHEGGFPLHNALQAHAAQPSWPPVLGSGSPIPTHWAMEHLGERRVQAHVATAAFLQSLHASVRLPMPLAPWHGLSLVLLPPQLLLQLE